MSNILVVWLLCFLQMVIYPHPLLGFLCLEGRSTPSIFLPVIVGKKEVTIVKFVNRKFAKEGLYKGKNLQGTMMYSGTRIFINNSFCHEYKRFGRTLRKLKRTPLLMVIKLETVSIN